MSTQLAPVPALAPETLSLDEVTRQRLLVAEATAETLEHLADARAWSALDPAVGAHLIGQSSRLRVFLARVRTSSGFTRDEQQLLAFRRLERRLEIVEELLGPRPADAAPGASPQESTPAGKLYLGDFTGSKLSEEQRRQSRERRVARKKSNRLSLSWSPEAKRLASYVAIGAFVAAASVLMRVATPTHEKHGVQEKPRLAIEPNQFLEDLKTFLPVQSTMLVNGCLTASVDPAWMDRPVATRRTDAGGAAVFLSNRKVRRFVISLPTGVEVYRTDGVTSEFSEDSSGLAPMENRIGLSGPRGTVRPSTD